MAASFIARSPFPHGPVPKHGLEMADVRIPPGRVQLRLGMPVQLRRSADAWQLPRRVHLDHRQGRLRGREPRRPRRRPTGNLARGGPFGPWHPARAHRRPGDARTAEGARNARQRRGRRTVRRVRVRHRTLAHHDRGAIRRPAQRDAVHNPGRLGKGLRPGLSRIKNPVTGEEEELYLDKPTGFTAKRSELGMSTLSRFKAPGLEYDNSGQYAEFSRFAYTGP